MTKQEARTFPALLAFLLLMLIPLPVQAHALDNRETALTSTAQVFTLAYSRDTVAALQTMGKDSFVNVMTFMNPVRVSTGFFADKTGKYLVVSRNATDPALLLPDYIDYLRQSELSSFADNKYSLYYLVFYRNTFYVADLCMVDDSSNDLALLALHEHVGNISPVRFRTLVEVDNGMPAFVCGFRDPTDSYKAYLETLVDVMCNSTLALFGHDTSGATVPSIYSCQDPDIDSSHESTIIDVVFEEPYGISYGAGINSTSNGALVIDQDGMAVGVMSLYADHLITSDNVILFLEKCGISLSDGISQSQAAVSTPEALPQEPHDLELSEKTETENRGSTLALCLIATFLILILVIMFFWLRTKQRKAQKPIVPEIDIPAPVDPVREHPAADLSEPSDAPAPLDRWSEEINVPDVHPLESSAGAFHEPDEL